MTENKNNKKMNKKSFYFEDYNHSYSDKTRLNISEDRIYLLFFVFFCLISIFAIKIFFTSLKEINFKNNQNHYNSIFKSQRGDIYDKNGEVIATNIRVYHAAIKPNLIKNKKNFVLKLQIIYPYIDIENIKKKLKKINTFI